MKHWRAPTVSAGRPLAWLVAAPTIPVTEPEQEAPDSTGSDTMRAYLVTTRGLVGLLAAAHLVITILESSRLAPAPWFVVQGRGIGALAGGLSIWAWGLFRASTR